MWTVAPVPFYLAPFFAGAKSVILFFVLSGYVLSLPYWHGQQLSYGKYLVRRFCRIYLPYAGALFIAVLVGSRLHYSHLQLTKWFYATWHDAFTPKLIASQLVFAYSKHNGAAINMAFWSLRYEVEMSIVFPAICWVALRLPTFACCIIAGMMSLIGMERLPYRLPPFMHEFTSLCLWGSAFVFGAILAREREAIRRFYLSLSIPDHYLLFAMVVLGFYRGESTELVNIPAACGVIVIADCSRAHRWLSAPLPLYLGRISYSLYLLHGTVLLATIILFYGKLPIWVVACIYFSVSFAVSHLYSKFVEESAVRLGRRLTA